MKGTDSGPSPMLPKIRRRVAKGKKSMASVTAPQETGRWRA